MKKLTILLIFVLSTQFTSTIFADEIKDNEFKFRITLPSNWVMTKTEEASKNQAISYSFSKGDSSIAIMLLAFKVDKIKVLDDFVYTLEKDRALNIPQRSGEYKDFDMGSYDGKMAIYKDAEFVETVYYYRTKNSETGENYAYMLRFITYASKYNTVSQIEIQNIADSFKTTL